MRRWLGCVILVFLLASCASAPPAGVSPTYTDQPVSVPLGEYPLSPSAAARACTEILERRGFQLVGGEGAGPLVFTLTEKGYAESPAYSHNKNVSSRFQEARLELSFYRADGGTSVIATGRARVRLASANGGDFTDVDLASLNNLQDTQPLYAEVYQPAFQEIAQRLRAY